MEWVVVISFLVGLATIAASGYMWLFSSPDNHNLAEDLVRIGGGLVTLPGFFAYLRWRESLPGIESLRVRDTRAPVLYLRAFSQETLGFTWGPKEEMAKYTRAPIYNQTWPTIAVTLDEFLGDELSRDIGPFIALGNPEDLLPPEGASRSYADDANWKETFLQLAGGAALVLVQVSGSMNLLWELTEIRARGWYGKMFVITPPVPRPNWAHYRWVANAFRSARGVPKPNWTVFSSMLSAAGFTVSDEPPGPGSILSFDASATILLVQAGAQNPEDFSKAIKRRIAWKQT